MDIAIDYLLIGLVFLTLAASFLLAFFHGLGFSMTGISEVKPSYGNRYLISLFAQIFNYAISYFIFNSYFEMMMSGEILTKATDAGSWKPVIAILVINHLSYSLGTFLFFEAKKDIKAALLSPIFITILSGVLFYLALNEIMKLVSSLQ